LHLLLEHSSEFKCNYFIFLIFSLIISCHDEKLKEFKVCDCTGPLEENIIMEGGDTALSKDGFKIISVKYGYLTPCEDIPVEFQKDGALVRFSGKIIPTCKKEHSGYAIWSILLEISAIEHIDTLYESGRLTIQIIKTEDFGNSPGFGYIISDKVKNFTIRQTEIPALVGTDPFKTYEEALKIAFLVAYRLENFNDFPSVTLGDLNFLKIVEGG